MKIVLTDISWTGEELTRLRGFLSPETIEDRVILTLLGKSPELLEMVDSAKNAWIFKRGYKSKWVDGTK